LRFFFNPLFFPPQTTCLPPRAKVSLSQTTCFLPQTTCFLSRTTFSLPQTTCSPSRAKLSLPQKTCFLPQTTCSLPRDEVEFAINNMFSATDKVSLPQTTCSLPRMKLSLSQTTCSPPRTKLILPQTTCSLPRMKFNLPQTTLRLWLPRVACHADSGAAAPLTRGGKKFRRIAQTRREQAFYENVVTLSPQPVLGIAPSAAAQNKGAKNFPPLPQTHVSPLFIYHVLLFLSTKIYGREGWLSYLSVMATISGLFSCVPAQLFCSVFWGGEEIFIRKHVSPACSSCATRISSGPAHPGELPPAPVW